MEKTRNWAGLNNREEIPGIRESDGFSMSRPSTRVLVDFVEDARDGLDKQGRFSVWRATLQLLQLAKKTQVPLSTCHLDLPCGLRPVCYACTYSLATRRVEQGFLGYTFSTPSRGSRRTDVSAAQGSNRYFHGPELHKAAEYNSRARRWMQTRAILKLI